MKLSLFFLSLLLSFALAMPPAPTPRFLTVRGRIPICRPRLVYRTGACLCNITFNRGTIFPKLSEACRNLYNRSPRNLSRRCLSLRGDMTTPEQVFTNAKRMLNICFINVDRIVLPPGSKSPGPRGGAPLATILMWMKEVRFIISSSVDTLESAFPPPAPSTAARAVVTGDYVKERRLTRFNDLRV